MNHVFSQLMFTGFVLALYFVIQVLHKREMKYKENRLFVFVCIFSSLWSFGFYGVNIQTVPEKAYLWRAIGMVGTFGYLISAQFLIAYLSDVKKIYRYLAQGFSLVGILIYFFVIQKSHVTYELSVIGMSYTFAPTFWNNFYNVYCVLVALNQFAMVLYMIKRPRSKRLKELGKKLLIVELITVLGMILDTVFPLLGQPAIPGSTLGQFAGLVVMYVSLSFFDLSRITISNMSEFIYYSLTVPVMVFDVKEKLQILNDTAYPFLGVDRKKMTDMSIEDIFTIDKQDAFEFEADSQSVDTVCRNNDKFCSLSVNKIFDNYDDKIGYIIIVTDQSERMLTMKHLEEAIKEAKYASQAKSVFLANMSHEIRTPMNAIMGFSELLLKMDISKEARSHVEDIQHSADNLLAIINDILDISKIESGKMELVYGNYYFANMLKDVSLIIGFQAQSKGLHFVMQVDETIPKELYGDNVRLRSVLLNLLNNAVKYTDEGTVKFEVSTISRDEKKIKLFFRVSDTGVGIKEDDLKTLFNNFERFDQKVHYGVEGSGLGLAIAKGYINLMGGGIRVSSVYGEGSIFTVEVEQEIINDAPIEKSYKHGKEMPGEVKLDKFTISGTKVLVVDDNFVNLKVAHGIMSSYGLEVDTAVNGMESVDKCKATNYDFVFMDQMMPGMDGPEAMRKIRQINDHYKMGGAGKIIVLTANAVKGTRELLIEQGFDEYLGKPINVERLERMFYTYIPTERMNYKVVKKEPVNPQQEDINYINATMPEVDVELGISHCGGQLEDYLKILEITYRYGEKQIEELETLWADKDYVNYGIKVHSLKSTTLNIGARDVSEEAKRQEKAAKDGEYDYIGANLYKLSSEFRGLLAKMENVLQHFGMMSGEANDEDDTDDMLDDKAILRVLTNIETCIDNFDFAKVFNILDEVKKCRIPSQYEEVINSIIKLMDDLSVDEVRELIAGVKEK